MWDSYIKSGNLSISMYTQNLPRILYIGDVPVECTMAGSALIYRLLQNYASEKLCIVETNLSISSQKSRLPNVQYKVYHYASKRLLKSRFVQEYASTLLATAPYRGRTIKKVVNNFLPDLIITVAHGFSWLTASAIASQLNLPLYLIVHDDWISFTPTIKRLSPLLDRKFSKICRQSKKIFCVSPYMADTYRKKYGVEGVVLYPTQAVDTPIFEEPPQKVKSQIVNPCFAYAGSIHSQGQANNLIALAKVLDELNGRLLVYTSLTQEAVCQFSLNKYRNIIIKPTIPYKEMILQLRESVDVLFAPMNFDLAAKTNMKLCFPSKLADYSAIGLPILIWGPNYCSAIQWAEQNMGVAEVVKDNTEVALRKSVEKLLNNADYRYQLARKSILLGRQYFSSTSIENTFYNCLLAK